MAVTPKQAKAISDIADLLYDFLPGKPYPYANQAISFQGVANEVGLSQFWTGGSKLPAINALLSNTYEHQKGKFCGLIIALINKGIIYKKKRNPMTKNEMVKLNNLILVLEFKIPELWDNDFLNSLAEGAVIAPIKNEERQVNYNALLTDFMALMNLEPKQRGFEFEKFLNRLFAEFELKPRSSFRLVGEQIDGSFELDGEYYLIEAKWQKTPLGISDLLTFHGKIAGKSSWTRGIVVSYNGFSKEGLEAFSKGRATNLITLDGQDFYAMLSKNIQLPNVLKAKIRWAAETGEIVKSVFELFT
ncbi:MAG: restriction endonuclease [Oscillospiraceae bacterium]|nr:restriction endonuclease [Oscillospiraceae bacterium]